MEEYIENQPEVQDDLLTEEHISDEYIIEEEILFEQNVLKQMDLENIVEEFIEIHDNETPKFAEDISEEECIDEMDEICEYESKESIFSGFQLLNEVIDNIMSTKDSELRFIKSTVVDIVEKFESDTKLEAEKSSEKVAKHLIDILIDRCPSMNRMVKNVICDIIHKFPSPTKICKDILNNVIDALPIDRRRPSEKDYSQLRVVFDQDPECKLYAGVNTLANNVLTSILKDSEIAANKKEFMQFGKCDVKASETVRNSSTYSWTRIGNFTIEYGKNLITKFIEEWVFKEQWLFNTEFLMGQSNSCSDFYLYEAKFGIPTKEYPIPQATASVFFTVEVSRILPKACPIKVTYVFEGNRVVHNCETNIFREDWLFNIVDAKIELFKRVDF